MASGLPIWTRKMLQARMNKARRLRAALEAGGLSKKAAELRAEQVIASRLFKVAEAARGGRPASIGEMLDGARGPGRVLGPDGKPIDPCPRSPAASRRTLPPGTVRQLPPSTKG